MGSLKRIFAHSLLALLIGSTAIAGPLSGPIDPTLPIDLPPTKPALPGMPTIEPIMIESRLGFMITTPILAFNNTGVLNYTVVDGLLSVDADALALLLSSGSPPTLVFPGAMGAEVIINIIVAPDGSLVGGVPGDDLVVTGAVDLTGDMIPDVDGVLLTGEVVEYMGEDSGGSTDFHAYRFQVTGGFLAGPFGSDIAIELTSEMSTFTGDYTVDFSGEAKGNIGTVECTGTIGDFVWLDLDGNGIQDDGEPGIGGVQVILTDQFGNMTTETTLANGFYQFSDLCAGTYTISINPASLPPEVAPTLINAPGSNDANDSNDADGTPVTLPTNDSSDQDTDFGYVPVTSALGDYVWEDLNMDGIQDSNEPPIEGVMVNLYNCEGEFLDSTTTDAFGFYQFTNLNAGCYVVEFILPDGLVFTLMDQNGEALDSDPDPTTGFTDPVFLGPGETNPDVDAGMFRPPSAELGDRFWEDLNGNGIQDPGEPGIEGVTVNLFDCAGNFLDSTTTSANGMYLFPDLDAGCYLVVFEPPADCVLTAMDAGSDDTADSDADPVNGVAGPINLADMQSDLTWDAGCYYTAGLGDFVWNDFNQDGIQDPGEPGIEDLLVILLDGDMMPTGMTTTTGSAGEYEFTGLAPGSYFVQFTNPPGFVFSPQDEGSDDTLDSDANGTGKTDKITLESGEFDPTIDAGVYIPDNPSISIEKSTNGVDADVPTGPFIPNGDPVLWEYVVTNTGNVTLINVVVTDDQGVIVDCPQDTLVPLEVMTCTGNGSATVDQYENLGTVTGDPPQGLPVTSDDPSHYFGANPSIDIEKATNGEDADTPTGPYITPGANVSWTYVVTNTGNVTLTDVTVTDDQGVTVMCPLTELAPNQIMTCNASGLAVIGQYANLGTVVGTPPDGAGGPVDDEDPSHYFGPAPSIDIEKATNGEDADTPTGPTVAVGSTVNWTYVVTNTGNVELTNISVTDDQGVSVSCPGDTLAPTESFICTASGTATAGQYANLGTVTGTPPPGAGDPVDDEDPSHYFGSDPSIDIEKATNGDDADTPTGPVVEIGSTVNWTYVVTNTGNVELTGINVTDDQGVIVSCPGDTLAPTESFICTASGTATAGQYANLGSVSGNPPVGPPVNDEDPSHYFGSDPSIDIEKATNGDDADNPTGPFILTGGAVNWTYVVTNTGNVPLSGITVTDSQGVAVICPASTLAPTDSFICTGTGTATVGQYANLGSVSGNPPVGPPVTDEDPSHYFGVAPGIDIEKSTNGEDADTPTGPSIEVGGAVTWTYVVTNTSNVTLTNVSVSDDQGVTVDCSDQNTLAPAGEAGDSFTCTASGTATAGQYANIGSVMGTPPVGPPVSDTDPSHYIGVELTELCVLAAIPDPVWSTSGSDHAFTLPGIDSSNEFTPAGSFIENPADGTAVLAGTITNRANPANGFDVVVNLSGKTDIPTGPGSPKKELRDSAYIENGGPVDTSTWNYYADYTGTLVGFGAYAGSVIEITPTGPAFQIGIGANNKNINFGASSWFDWVVTSQPNDGHFPATGEGDINVDIREDCTPPPCVPGDFADHFNSDSFSNNDGSLNWSTPWIEYDVAGTGPTIGNVMVWDGVLILSDNPDTGTHPSAAREADLSQFAGATLSFDYDTSDWVDSDDTVILEISNDGGATYETLEVFMGRIWGSRTYDISAYISSQTRIRFRVSKLYGGDKEKFKVDNLRIEGLCDELPQCNDPGYVKDRFSSTSFSNNDGSDNWSTPWIEYDVAGAGPNAGTVVINNGRLRMDDTPDTGTQPSIARQADLSGYTHATLSFDYWTSRLVDETDAVTLEISNDGGDTYETLEVFTGISGESDGWRTYDISEYISSETRIRFRVSNLFGGDKEHFKIDNVRIDYDCD